MSLTHSRQTQPTAPDMAKESRPLHGPDIELVVAGIMRVNGIPFFGVVAVICQQGLDIGGLLWVVNLAKQFWPASGQDTPGALQDIPLGAFYVHFDEVRRAVTVPEDEIIQ